MPLFSIRRSSTPTPSSSSASSSSLLNDDSEEQQGSTRKNRSLLEKIRCGRRFSPLEEASPSTQKPSQHEQDACTSTNNCKPIRRRGSKFCGFCDMRIAAVLLNFFHVVLVIVLELSEAFQWGNRNYFEDPPIFVFLAIGISGLGAFGALYFKPCPIYLSSIGLCFLWYMHVVESHIFELMLISFLLCVQIILAIEMMCGIMTPGTYAMEGYMDRDGRKVIKKIHGLSVDIGETAVEFAEEVSTVFEQKASGKIMQHEKQKQTVDVGGIAISEGKPEDC